MASPSRSEETDERDTVTVNGIVGLVLLDVEGPVIAVEAGDAPVARVQARRGVW